MNIGQRIKLRRKELGLSVDELSIILKKDRATIYRYEKSEIENLPAAILEPLALALKTTPAYLMGWEEIDDYGISHPDILPVKLKKFRMLGDIACGNPIIANEEHAVFVEGNADIDADFCLRAKGDSMIDANIYDGDIVFIKEQDEIPNGKIAAVLIEDEVTLKRIYIQDDTLTLLAANPLYPPQTYHKSDMLNIKILGRAVVVQSEIK